MNRVVLVGRLTRDPELRTLASGRTITQFTMSTDEYVNGHETQEYHSIVVWDRLGEICGQYLGKNQLISVEGRLQTRQWEDDGKHLHWKAEVVASAVEMLSGRKRSFRVEVEAEKLPEAVPA